MGIVSSESTLAAARRRHTDLNYLISRTDFIPDRVPRVRYSKNKNKKCRTVSKKNMSTTTTPTSTRKVVVVGAGPVGCLAAMAFAKRGWRVDLYEGRPGQCSLAYRTNVFHFLKKC